MRTKKSDAPISYRPPVGKAEELRARTAETGLSTNAFITERLFSHRRRSKGELRTLARLLGQAADLRDQLHEIALSGGGDPLLVEAALDELVMIRTALMGRRT